MNPLLTRVLLAAGGVMLAAIGIRVFSMPHRSRVAVFRVIWLGLLPLPIPIGFFTSPHFWGGLLILAGGILAVTSLRALKR